jgi:ankyrin repeat protein/V8-like Glu-specific endopeptidase
MKNAMSLIVLSTAFATQVHAGNLVVYGEDNRVEVYQASAAHQLLAKSTATMVSKHEMTVNDSNPEAMQFNQKTLRDWLEDATKSNKTKSLFTPVVQKAAAAGASFCKGTRFIDQPNAGMCSGFLIAPDLLVTAGHCVELENFCDEYKWVFDYQIDKDTQTAGVDVSPENIYGCKKVISNALISPLGLDYAVVQLERRVSGRAPLEINNNLKVTDKQGLLVIGSPSGLPLKVATGANVRKNSHPSFFSANLDTFQGNSGSAVFNSETGVVEGILVRGEDDYVPNQLKMCVEVKVCKTNECRGEDVSRLTSIPEVGLQKVMNQASVTGNIELLNRILSLNTWVDFYSKDGQSALIKAAGAAQSASLKALIAKGADVNLQDAKGNTSAHELAKVLSSDNAEALQALVDGGANLDIKNDLSETALIIAAKKLSLEGVKLLVAAGADKNAVDINNENAIFVFSRSGNVEAVIALAEMGVEAKSEALEIRDAKGDTLLLASIKANNIDSVIRLVRLGADLNAVDSQGENAIYSALKVGSLESVKMLVEAGIELEVENNAGISPLRLAKELKFKGAKKLIRQGRKEQRKYSKI